MGQYRKKPVVIDAMQWDGSKTDALGIVAWVASEGSNADWRPDGASLADPNCPVPGYHATHHYCPGCRFTSQPAHISILTLEGAMMASPSDWIIKGVQGEFYPCKPDIFEQTYEAVEPTPSNYGVFAKDGE